MKKTQDTNEKKKLTRGHESVRVLSANLLHYIVGGDGDTGTKRPV